MSRNVFTNPKAALAFAAATLVGAVAMVGTSKDSGVLPAVVEKLNDSRAANANDMPGTDGPAPPPSVFGDYAPAAQSPTAPVAPQVDPSAAPGSYTEVVMSPTGEAIPVVRDNPADAPR